MNSQEIDRQGDWAVCRSTLTDGSEVYRVVRVRTIDADGHANSDSVTIHAVDRVAATRIIECLVVNAV